MGKAMSKGVIVCDELTKALVLSIKKFAYLKNDNKLKLKMIAIISQDFSLTADIFKPNRKLMTIEPMSIGNALTLNHA